MDIYVQNLSEIKSLESLIHVKRENYKRAIHLGKEFEELKVMHLEVKKLEKELETLHLFQVSNYNTSTGSTI